MYITEEEKKYIRSLRVRLSLMDVMELWENHPMVMKNTEFPNDKVDFSKTIEACIKIKEKIKK